MIVYGWELHGVGEVLFVVCCQDFGRFVSCCPTSTSIDDTIVQSSKYRVVVASSASWPKLNVSQIIYLLG